MPNLHIHQYPYLDDNYGVLLHDPSTGATACIDCGEASAAFAALKSTGWTLTDIWVTHHHEDHTDGVLELKQATGATVIGPNPVVEDIQGLDKTVNDGDTFEFAGLTVRAIHTPGHTADMINYYLPDEQLLFAGDTLFTMGCGRLIECDAKTMFQSLSKLTALPPSTQVYSSHEYTQANIAFALSVDSTNTALLARAEQVKALRANNEPTVPSTLQEELDTNPFLRANDNSIRAALNMPTADDADVFAEIRLRKDNFQG